MSSVLSRIDPRSSSVVHSTEMYKVIVSLRAVQAKVKSFTLVYFPWFYSLRGLHALYGVGGGIYQLLDLENPFLSDAKS